MNKSLNISLLLLLLGLVLFVCFGCESQRTRPVVIAPAPVEAAPVPVERPAPVEQKPSAVSECGPYIISRTYPCAECGLILLEKAMPEEVELNTPFNYSIKVTNLTDMTLTEVFISEDLPENFEFTNANPQAQEDMENRLVWTVDALAPRASERITVTGMALDAKCLEHYTTVVTSQFPACATVKVVQPRLELLKDAPPEVLLCDAIPVEFVVANAGTGSARDVKIVDILPTGLQTADGESELVLDAGTLTAGQSRKLAAKLWATKPGKYATRAVATSTTGQEAEAPSVTTVVVQPLLTIEKAGPERHYLGDQLTYAITVANKGDAPARNTVVEDTLPAAIAGVKATTGAKLVGSKLTWQLGTIAPKTSQKVRIAYTPTKAGTLTSTATATAYCADAVEASVETIVAAIPAIMLEVIDVEDPVEIGKNTTYVITVTNQGSAPSTNISVVCTLEENVQFVSSTGPTVGSMEDGKLIFDSLSRLGPKATATWRVVVIAIEPGDVRFKVTMNTDELTRPVEETEATRLFR